MKNQKQQTNKPDEIVDNKFPGYPPYPASEDIYNNYEKIDAPDHEAPAERKKRALPLTDNFNEKDYNDDYTGADLDIPGAELDDEQEANGSEDEENNYYSLGGDNHNDLEEDQGEAL